MNIEVVHNPDKLPFRKTILVNNVRLAAEKLQLLLDARRDRGMRLRVAYDKKGGWIELSGRCFMPVEVATRFLKDSKFYIRETNEKTI
jgi:hypothetical protein